MMEQEQELEQEEMLSTAVGLERTPLEASLTDSSAVYAPGMSLTM
jgi:hypothetical protein